MKTKIAVIGLGFVGLTFASFLGSKKINVIGVDANDRIVETLSRGMAHFYEPNMNNYLKKALKGGLRLQNKITKDVASSDFIFITVGTPPDEKGNINLEYVKSAISSIAQQISNLKTVPTIVIKSTVVPGTALNVIKPIFEKQYLRESINYNLLTNPEFLREGYAMKDTISPHIIVIGGSHEPVKKLIKFYKTIYPNFHRFIETNNSTAEMIKYANNAFLAMKISFINSIANMCQKLGGTNVDDVANAIGTDPRIGSLFLKAGPGYGGSCFPKDLQAFINFSNQIGYNPILLEAIRSTNALQIKIIMDLIKRELGNINKKKIGLLGLSFKENTDDVRESVSIKLIYELLQQDCNVLVHDPKAIPNTRQIFDQKITYCTNIDDVFSHSDCVVILTPWAEYKNLKEKSILKMNNPLIIDTRRILEIKNKKIRYVGIGLGKNNFS